MSFGGKGGEDPTNAVVPGVLAILAAAGLQLLLSPQFTLIHPRWLLPSLEIALLVTLTVLNPRRLTRYTPVGKYLSLLLVLLISWDNGLSAVLLDFKLITGTAGGQAGPLLKSAAAIYLTNVIAFGIWYWELDRGGPFARAAASSPYPDFLFPQMTQHHLAPDDWEPRFGDYLYVSFTNATAFSPTDTMPLTRWAKSPHGWTERYRPVHNRARHRPCREHPQVGISAAARPYREADRVYLSPVAAPSVMAPNSQ